MKKSTALKELVLCLVPFFGFVLFCCGGIISPWFFVGTGVCVLIIIINHRFYDKLQKFWTQPTE
jgi:hypothetical protein